MVFKRAPKISLHLSKWYEHHDLQKVNRYIVSNTGTKLIKILPQLKNEDGTLKKIGNFVNDKLEGEFRTYHDYNEGILKKICNYLKNLIMN